MTFAGIFFILNIVVFAGLHRSNAYARPDFTVFIFLYSSWIPYHSSNCLRGGCEFGDSHPWCYQFKGLFNERHVKFDEWEGDKLLLLKPIHSTGPIFTLISIWSLTIFICEMPIVRDIRKHFAQLELWLREIFIETEWTPVDQPVYYLLPICYIAILAFTIPIWQLFR